jgi:DNA-binding transcriptional MocR family regulator
MHLRSPWKPHLSDQFTSPTDRLVGALAKDILQGELESGARLPAHRDLADKLGIGVGTVTKAYAVLERRGLVRTVKGSGTFVALTQSRTGAVIDLSRNVPPAAITERLLGRTLTALAKRVDSGLFNDYPPLGGHVEHRRLLAQWFATIGMHADPDLLLLTSGARHGLSLAFSVVCGNGGTLLTEMQTYPGALVLARHHGLNVVGIAMDGEGILPDALDKALQSLRGTRTALYVTPTMQNPTTATMSRARRDAVVAVCREHDIAIVEDDVYNLGISPEQVPLAMLAPERTFYANSLSKSLNPTLGIGGLVVPPMALGQTENMFKATSILVSPLSCAVMEQWLLDGTAEAIRHAIQHESGLRMDCVLSLLAGRVRVPSYPGHHLWMPMPLKEAEMLREAAAAFGILLTPPATTAVAPDAQESGIRICVGAVSMSDLTSALTTIARLKCETEAQSGNRSLLF